MKECPTCGQKSVLVSVCPKCGGEKSRIEHIGHPWLGVSIADLCTCNGYGVQESLGEK